MARITDMTCLNKKILDAEEKVLLIKKKYDLAIAELEELQDRKKELQQKMLLTAIAKSGKSFDEVLRLIKL